MASIRVGKPDTTHDAAAHTPGVRQGNEPGGTAADPGLIETGEIGSGRPGINPEKRNPIDPNSPNLPPN
jgi:hypothetical protein